MMPPNYDLDLDLDLRAECFFFLCLSFVSSPPFLIFLFFKKNSSYIHFYIYTYIHGQGRGARTEGSSPAYRLEAIGYREGPALILPLKSTDRQTTPISFSFTAGVWGLGSGDQITVNGDNSRACAVSVLVVGLVGQGLVRARGERLGRYKRQGDSEREFQRGEMSANWKERPT